MNIRMISICLQVILEFSFYLNVISTKIKTKIYFAKYCRSNTLKIVNLALFRMSEFNWVGSRFHSYTRNIWHCRPNRPLGIWLLWLRRNRPLEFCQHASSISCVLASLRPTVIKRWDWLNLYQRCLERFRGPINTNDSSKLYRQEAKIHQKSVYIPIRTRHHWVPCCPMESIQDRQPNQRTYQTKCHRTSLASPVDGITKEIK